MKRNLNDSKFYAVKGSEIQVSICRALKLLSFVGIIFLSGMANGQSPVIGKHPPIDVPIEKSAPHLPIMLKASGEGNSFSYGGFEYAKDLNTQNLKNWMNEYPNEVSNYTKIIKGLLKQNRDDLKSQLFAPIYIDAKAQYLLIKKLLK